MSELRYENLTAEWAPKCRELELSVFSHASADELLSQSDFEAYARVFPEGFFLCLDGDRLAGNGLDPQGHQDQHRDDPGQDISYPDISRRHDNDSR